MQGQLPDLLPEITCGTCSAERDVVATVLQSLGKVEGYTLGATTA
jgi:hypothetical protein